MAEDNKKEVDLDNISNVLFSGLDSVSDDKEEQDEEPVEEEKVEEAEEVETKEEKKDKKLEEQEEVEEKVAKTQEIKENKKPSKIECEDKEYKDPITEEYKLEFNNKIGKKVRGERYAENFY